MKVQLLGHYYKKGNNLGDEAIHEQVIKDLIYIDPGIRIVNDGKTYDKPDLFILGGGGMYSDWQSDAIDTWLPPAVYALDNHIPTVAYGVGIGPLLTETGKDRMFNTFKRMDLVMVRDEYSAQELNLPGVIVTADPAVRYRARKLNVGFNIVSLNITGLDNFYINLGRHLKTMFNVDICCLWKAHLDYAKKIADKIGSNVMVVDLSQPANMLNKISDYDYWVGTQYHGCIYALMNAVKTLMLTYHPKCEGLNNLREESLHRVMLGDGHNLPAEDLDKQLLKAIVIINQEWAWREKLMQQSQLNAELLKDFCKQRGLI